MAVNKKGNPLTTLVYQKGVTIQNDGYGLLTSTVLWWGDVTATPPATTAGGAGRKAGGAGRGGPGAAGRGSARGGVSTGRSASGRGVVA